MGILMTYGSSLNFGNLILGNFIFGNLNLGSFIFGKLIFGILIFGNPILAFALDGGLGGVGTNG